MAVGENRVVNGDFSNYLAGWTTNFYENPSGVSGVIKMISASSQTHAEFIVQHISGSVTASLSQQVDFTGVSTLAFYTQGDNYPQTQEKILTVALDGNIIGSYARNEMGQKSIDVSAYSGVKTLTFTVQAYHGESSVRLTNVQAVNDLAIPTIYGVTVNPASQAIDQPIGVIATYTAGMPATTYFAWDWDNDGDVDLTTTSPTATIPANTYPAPGTYAVKCTVSNDYGMGNSATGTAGIEPGGSFTATPSQGPAPLTVYFTPELSGGTSLVWDFGDGSGTSVSTNPTHTYTANGVYTVTLTVSGPGGQTVITREDLITVSDQYIRWDESTYTAGDTATISWSLINPNFATTAYAYRIYTQDAAGNPMSPVTDSISITTATGSGTANTTGWAGGSYIAVILINGVISDIYASATVQTTATLTVKLAANNVVWTNATLVTVISGGTTIASLNVTNGTAVFPGLITKTYNLIATTEGYNQQTLTVTLTSDTTVTMDFVKGSSAGTTTGEGWGQQYAATFVTFRVLDRITGIPVQGAHVAAIGKQVTNPLDWIGQLFGFAWGAEILDTKVSGLTDRYGVITFAMFPTVYYEVTTTYLTITDVRPFQASQAGGEYIIQLEVRTPQVAPAEQTVLTTVSAADGTIVVNYTDASLTTSKILIEIQEQTIDRTYVPAATREIIAQSANETFIFAEWSGKSYRINITSDTSAYGTLKRAYDVTFPGPIVNLGFPDDRYYLILVIGILTALAGIGVYLVNVRMVPLLLVFFAWIFLFMGWLTILGPASVVGLITATVFAVLVYIAGGGT
jgi:PKD repeat protein